MSTTIHLIYRILTWYYLLVTTQALQCHVCISFNNMMSCDNDPKSIQYLDCEVPEASRYGELLIEQTRTKLNRSGTHSCVFIKYKVLRDMVKTNDEITIRSCLNTSVSWCEKVVARMVTRRNISMVECNQCEISFCNGDNFIGNGGFSMIILLLSLFLMS